MGLRMETEETLTYFKVPYACKNCYLNLFDTLEARFSPMFLMFCGRLLRLRGPQDWRGEAPGRQGKLVQINQIGVF